MIEICEDNATKALYFIVAVIRCMLLRTDLIIDPSLCLLKEGVFSFHFGLESIGCSIYNKSAKSFAFDKLNDSPSLPVKSVRILLYFDSDDVPAILVRRQQRNPLCRVFIAGRDTKARGVEPKPVHLFIDCLSRYGKARFV